MSGPPVDGQLIPVELHKPPTNAQVYKARRHVAGNLATDAADCKFLLDMLGILDPVATVDDQTWTGGHPYHVHRPRRRKP
jgi:hypothetical protein